MAFYCFDIDMTLLRSPHPLTLKGAKIRNVDNERDLGGVDDWRMGFHYT